MAQFFNKKSIIHKTMQVAGSTMISRVLGVIRELLTVKYLGAGIASGFDIVVTLNFFFILATTPAFCIIFAIRLREHVSPDSNNSACTRGLP